MPVIIPIVSQSREERDGSVSSAATDISDVSNTNVRQSPTLAFSSSATLLTEPKDGPLLAVSGNVTSTVTSPLYRKYETVVSFDSQYRACSFGKPRSATPQRIFVNLCHSP